MWGWSLNPISDINAFTFLILQGVLCSPCLRSLCSASLVGCEKPTLAETRGALQHPPEEYKTPQIYNSMVRAPLRVGCLA